jgi:thiamine pyrophosphokinase
MRVVVVASGELADADAAWLADAGLVIAADGGATSLDALGRLPDLLVGDLDSVGPALVTRLEAAGTRVERHPVDKEASDTELAVEAAIGAGASEVVVLGAFGGDRLDHELANVLLLADPALDAIEVTAVTGTTRVRAVRPGQRLDLAGRVGDLVSLLPLGDVAGVTTGGLRWRLDGATLRSGRSRGLSNEVLAPPASVQITGGVLLVVETSRGDPT